MWSLCLHALGAQGSLVQKRDVATKEVVIVARFRVVQADTQLHPAAPDYREKNKNLIKFHLPLNPMSTSCASSIAWNVCYHIKKYVDQTVINQKEYLNNTSSTMHTRSSPLVICIFWFFFVLNRFWNNHKASLTLENQQAQANSLYFCPQIKWTRVHCL